MIFLDVSAEIKVKYWTSTYPPNVLVMKLCILNANGIGWLMGVKANLCIFIRTHFTRCTKPGGCRFSYTLYHDATTVPCADLRILICRIGRDHMRRHDVLPLNICFRPGLINLHTHVDMVLVQYWANDRPIIKRLHQLVWPPDTTFFLNLNFASMARCSNALRCCTKVWHALQTCTFTLMWVPPRYGPQPCVLKLVFCLSHMGWSCVHSSQITGAWLWNMVKVLWRFFGFICACPSLVVPCRFGALVLSMRRVRRKQIACLYALAQDSRRMLCFRCMGKTQSRLLLESRVISPIKGPWFW